MSAEATMLTGDEDVDRSFGEGEEAKLRAPLESILMGLEPGLCSSFNFLRPEAEDDAEDFANGFTVRPVRGFDKVGASDVVGVMDIVGGGTNGPG